MRCESSELKDVLWSLPQSSYRIAIQSEGMIEDLVKNLSCDNEELQMHCASAIFKVRFERPNAVSDGLSALLKCFHSCTRPLSYSFQIERAGNK